MFTTIVLIVLGYLSSVLFAVVLAGLVARLSDDYVSAQDKAYIIYMSVFVPPIVILCALVVLLCILLRKLLDNIHGC